MAVDLTDANFDELTGQGVTLVDFWAPWCGPCRMQGPILDEVSEQAGDGITVAKVNVDEAPQIAARFGVRSIPTLIIFKDGEVAQQFVGVQQAPALLQALEA